jgi:hypothetical protein
MEVRLRLCFVSTSQFPLGTSPSKFNHEEFKGNRAHFPFN